MRLNIFNMYLSLSKNLFRCEWIEIPPLRSWIDTFEFSAFVHEKEIDKSK